MKRNSVARRQIRLAAVDGDLTDPPPVPPVFVPGHRIETGVKLYLALSDDGARWLVSSVTVDGFPFGSDPA